MQKNIYHLIFIIALAAISFISSSVNSQALNQGFNTPSFPPSGWTQTEGLWDRVLPSAFGLGQGSAMADFYDIKGGTFALVTPVFTASIAGDSLIFADAYRTYIDENDQLEILYSTNAGATYLPFVVLNGGKSGPLVTAPPSKDAWLEPNANEWKFQRFALPPGTNQISFNGVSSYGNNLFIDSIYVKNAIVGIEPIGNEIPRVYSLEQNYPNPFNPVTNIRFSIPLAGNVKIVISDILGRIVATIVDEFKPAGNYVVDFNASALSSGVYFYRISSGDFTETKKMLIIK